MNKSIITANRTGANTIQITVSGQAFVSNGQSTTIVGHNSDRLIVLSNVLSVSGISVLTLSTNTVRPDSFYVNKILTTSIVERVPSKRKSKAPMRFFRIFF
jgi:hypothetical protein